MKPHHTGSSTDGVSPRVASLLNYHTDLAKFAVNDELPVFWVLDLEDEKAVNVALGFKEREELEAMRDKEREEGKIAALTITSPMEFLNLYRQQVQKRPEMPDPGPDSLYLVLCSEERFMVAKLPRLTAQSDKAQ